MAMVAQDTFAAEVDGAPVTVMRGSVWPDKHAVVKLDGGRGVLFKEMVEEPERPRRASRAKAAPARDEAG